MINDPFQRLNAIDAVIPDFITEFGELHGIELAVMKVMDVKWYDIFGHTRLASICLCRFLIAGKLREKGYSNRFLAEYFRRDRTTMFHYFKQYDFNLELNKKKRHVPNTKNDLLPQGWQEGANKA